MVRGVHRCMLAGRISAGSPDDDAAVLTTAAQFWALISGFVMLELAGYYGHDGATVLPLLASMNSNLLVALGDSPERVAQSLKSAGWAPKTPGSKRRVHAAVATRSI